MEKLLTLVVHGLQDQEMDYFLSRLLFFRIFMKRQMFYRQALLQRYRFSHKFQECMEIVGCKAYSTLPSQNNEMGLLVDTSGIFVGQLSGSCDHMQNLGQTGTHGM